MEELYPPQVEAVKRGLLRGAHLVLAVPTAAGKTLVGLMSMLKKTIEGRGKALYMVPLKAIASEKYEEFSSLESLGLKVAVSTGDYDSSDPWLSRYDIIVATNEKVDSLIRHGAGWLEDVGVVVADEIHLLGDASRGPTLEVVLARLKKTCREAQFIALSATIRNAREIASWLGAEVVESSWRPVPLKTGVYLDGRVLFNDGTVLEAPMPKGIDPASGLAYQAIRGGGQALVFNNTRQSSIAYAERVKSLVATQLTSEERRRLREVADEVVSEGELNRISQKLAECIRGGTAFHHAGLSPAHRKIVEGAFRSLRLLKVVCATPTLAAGVNLPARRVIVQDYRRYDPSLGYGPIPTLEFHQMAGRAGRPQFDEYGEAILIAKTRDEAEALMENYIQAQPERIWSKLASEPALRSHVLSYIASLPSASEEGLASLISNTFYAHQYGSATALPSVRRVLSFLEREGFIASTSTGYMATMLGLRVSQLYIDPLSAVVLREGLSKRPSATPLSYLLLMCSTPDVPKIYLRRGDRKRLGPAIDSVRHDALIPPPDPEEDPYGFEEYLASLKTALILHDWIEEAPEDLIIEKHNVGPGDIYSLSQTTKWIAYSARELCRTLGLTSHIQPLFLLEERLKIGCREELLELTRLEGIGRVRARALFNAGFKSLEDLAKASLDQLIAIPSIGLETAKSILRQLGK
ncbi:MAG: DEAD/DEAH box helicase [Candidatus Nezhaarchaeota archaeon]|nr:DEAD/DEAH box helicase [Candidatus Nezhaarchaeota archaeon]